MKFNEELIQLGKSLFERPYHKKLLKRAFKDGIYSIKDYRYRKFNRFLEEKGYFIKEYDWYKEWYITFLESSYSNPVIMEKNIISLFLSLPLDSKGLLIFNQIFFYYEEHLFEEFALKLSRSRILDELFIHYSEPFMSLYEYKDFIQIMSLFEKYFPYISNYHVWRSFVNDIIPVYYRLIPLGKNYY